MARFVGINVQVLGISIDHVPCLKAWADSFGGISYPILSDFWPHGFVAEKYGVLRREGYSERAIFIIDDLGVIRYIDIHNIDDQPDNEILFKELERIVPQTAGSAAESIFRDMNDFVLPKGGVIMYCTTWCPDCRRARAWLDDRNIAYTEVDIDKYPVAASQVKKWADGKQITPTFDIDGIIIVDFNEAQLNKALNT